MTRSLPRSLRLSIATLAVCQLGLTATPTWAQTPVAPPAPPPPPAEAAPPAPTAMSTPAMTGPLVANPAPYSIDAGPIGKVYITGAVSGFAMFQSDPTAVDHTSRLDLTNGHLIAQTTEGLVQFYAQGGAYSFPTVGAPYITAGRTTGDFFGAFPVGYIKLAPTDEFSVIAGKLPTLIGAEYAFTFQNMNIERGLLWFQEPIISRGIQANYTMGPVALSVSLNDGLYSDRYNWISGLATWTIDKQNTLAVAAGGNASTTTVATLATPTAQNNSRIVNLIYTYNSAPWVITPYFQYTDVPANSTLGFTSGASTYGAALLASYAFTDNVSLAGRAEIIGSSGGAGAANLLGYGPGSAAWSLTLTPTYQQGIFFARAEGSVVGISSVAAGSGFGRSGTSKTQGRFMVETGILF
jgi:Putative beta-barrel porin-2, OmpL-like. bbp2